MQGRHILGGIVCAFVATATALPSVAQPWQLLSGTTYGVATKLAVTDGALLLYDREKVQRSTDNGASWADVAVSSEAVYSMASRGTTLFAVGPGSGGVDCFRSDDDGATWRVAGSLTPPSSGTTPLVVAHDGRVVAVSNRQAIYVSTDDGATFSTITVPSGIGNIVDADWNGSQWAACGTGGAYRSDDDGATWTALPVLPGTGGNVQHVAYAGQRLIASGTLGAWYWNGTTWGALEGLPASIGLPPVIQDLAVYGDDAVVVCQEFGSTTSVQFLDASSTTWTGVGDVFPTDMHGSQRGMLQPAARGIYVHYVSVSGTTRGTFYHPLPATSVDDDRATMVPMRIAPVPATETVTLTFDGVLAESATVYVRDAAGHTLQVLALEAGTSQVVVALGGTASGTITVDVVSRSSGRSLMRRTVPIVR